MKARLKKLIFISKQKAFRKKAIEFYTNFNTEKYMSDDQRQEINFNKRKKIIAHAYKNTVFYHKKYSMAGLHPDDIKTNEDFQKIPPLTKDEIRNNCNDLISANTPLSSLRQSTTGGSTGVPLKIYHDKRIPIDTVAWSFLESIDTAIWENAAHILRYNPLKKHPFINPLMWYPTRRCFLDASFLDDENCYRFYLKCIKISPVYISGYVGAIYQFANWLKKRNYRIPSLKAIWTTSAPLPPTHRIELQKTFECKVYSQYGCCEVFWLASECQKQNGLHYYDTIRHIECVDDHYIPVAPNEYGETLITDLLNFAFPLIRYRNGDRTSLLDLKCSCGCQWPLMGPVRGRVTDNIYFADGACIAGDFITTIFDDDPEAVLSFQVIQEKDFSITIYYVPAASDSDQRVERVRQKLMCLISGRVQVNLQKIDHIDHDRGKFRFIISEADKNNN